MKLRKLWSLVLALSLCASLMAPMASAESGPAKVSFGGTVATRQSGSTYKTENLQAWTSVTEEFAARAANLTESNAQALRFRCEMKFTGLTLSWTDAMLSNYTMTDDKGLFVNAEEEYALNISDNTLIKRYKLDFANNEALKDWENIEAKDFLTTILFGTGELSFNLISSSNPAVTAKVTAYFDGNESNTITVAEGSSNLILWRGNTSSVTAHVTSPNAGRVSVHLYSTDDKVIGPLVKNLEGAQDYHADFSFADVPNGTYNLVAVQDIEGGNTVTMTQLIELTDDSICNITMPEGEINSIVEVEPGTPQVVVGGLDKVAAAKADAKVDAGEFDPTNDTLTVTMTVEMVTETTADNDTQDEIGQLKDEIKKDFKDSTTTKTQYYDIDLTLQINDADPETIYNAGKTIRIDIPFDMSKMTTRQINSIKMYRYHKDELGNETTIALKKNNSGADGTYSVDTDNNVIHLYATKFSTYAIVYVPSNTPSHHSHSSSSSTSTSTSTSTNTGFQGCQKDRTCPMYPFTDISPKAWYHDGVHWALENSVMIGVGNNKFAPIASTTRAMVAVMLWRLEGSPASGSKSAFTDVQEGQWFADGIRWATDAGVILGYGNGMFGPNDAVTREQLATMLYRYAQYKKVNVTVSDTASLDAYADADSVSGYAVPAVKWANAVGIVNGFDDENGVRVFAPKDESQRVVVATMFMRYYTLVIK